MGSSAKALKIRIKSVQSTEHITCAMQLVASSKLRRATERMEEDIRGFFLPRAEKTGTLWEHMDTTASCNHGFASHVLVWLDRLGYLLHSEEE